MSIQAPPNLYGGDLVELIAAGINDWGGVSPLTPDHVNPEAPWPHLDRLADDTARAGCDLVERLTVYPSYVRARDEWLAPRSEEHTSELQSLMRNSYAVFCSKNKNHKQVTDGSLHHNKHTISHTR